MNDKIIGDIKNLNVTIISPTENLVKGFINEGYSYLNVNNLVDINISESEIINILGLTAYFNHSDIQNKIIANIFKLINEGKTKLIIDELLTFVDLTIRKKLIKFLKEKEIKFVLITSDTEDALFTEYLVVMFDNKIALEGNTIEVLKEEKLLRRMGLNLPFIVDLSIQLKYYGLVDKIYLEQKELVEDLWK